MKTIKSVIIGLFMLIAVNAFSQATTYSTRFTVTDSTYQTISLNGEYQTVYFAIADTIASSSLSVDVNFGTDTTWYTGYYFANFGTTAPAFTAKTFAEGTLLEMCDKAIRKMRFYLLGANATWILELKARR